MLKANKQVYVIRTLFIASPLMSSKATLFTNKIANEMQISTIGKEVCVK